MDFRWMDLMFEEVTLVSNTPQLTFVCYFLSNQFINKQIAIILK